VRADHFALTRAFRPAHTVCPVKRLITTIFVLSTASFALAQDEPAGIVKSSARRETPKPAAVAPTTQKIDVLGPATRVTMTLKNATAKEAFAELEKQSGFKPGLQAANVLDRAAGSIDIDVKDQPWTAVFLLICEKANLFAMNAPQWQVMQAMGLPRFAGRLSYAGPVTIVARSMIVDADMQYGGGNLRRTLVAINCSMAVEPRVAGLTVGPAPVVEEVLDEQGTKLELLPVDAGTVSSLNSYNVGWQGSFNINLALPPTAAKKLSKIRGHAYGDIISGTATLRIKDILNTKETKFDFNGVPFTINSITQNGPMNYILDLRVPRTDTTALIQRVQGGGMGTPFQPKLENKPNAGASLMQCNVIGDQIQIQMMIMTNDRSGDGKPNVDLVWQLPSEIKRVEIPFEFNDLPIPQ
jgi:hypothetical protein